MLSKIATASAAAALCVAFALPAVAQSQPKLSPETQTKLRKACMNDVRTLCKDAKAAGGKIVQCLADNREKVSTECKTAMGEAQMERQSKMKQ